MERKLIAVNTIASIHGRNRRSLHKLVRRLGLNVVKERTDDSRGQLSSHITESDYETLKRHLDDYRVSSDPVSPEVHQSEFGVFYLVLLEPKLDPGRFKVGFTTNINERMRSYLTATPFAEVKETWPCKLIWEKTAIECISQDCEQLYTEVFRTNNIDDVIMRAKQFFNLMPQPTNNDD